jgi:hypothetical protein
LARYDSTGTQLWLCELGTSADDWARCVAPDGVGGVYVAGDTGGSLGDQNAGGGDAWIARFDSESHQLWIRQLGTSAFDVANALAPDASGGAYVAGGTEGRLGDQFAGGSDPWLARYDSAGQQVWIVQFGAPSGETAYAAAPDGAGGIYLSGVTNGSLFGASEGGRDVWLAHYDGEGNQLWSDQFGASDWEWPNSAAADGAGGFYVAGTTGSSLGGPNAGQIDAWFARYGTLCLGDVDADRDVDLSDLTILLLHFGTPSGAAYADGDLDADGDVDISDLTLLLASYGTTCS